MSKKYLTKEEVLTVHEWIPYLEESGEVSSDDRELITKINKIYLEE